MCATKMTDKCKQKRSPHKHMHEMSTSETLAMLFGYMFDHMPQKRHSSTISEVTEFQLRLQQHEVAATYV